MAVTDVFHLSIRTDKPHFLTNLELFDEVVGKQSFFFLSFYIVVILFYVEINLALGAHGVNWSVTSLYLFAVDISDH